MRDRFNREIVLGDQVAFMEPGYRNLLIGHVIRITPQRVRVSYRRNGVDQEFLTTGRDVVVNPNT